MVGGFVLYLNRFRSKAVSFVLLPDADENPVDLTASSSRWPSWSAIPPSQPTVREPTPPRSLDRYSSCSLSLPPTRQSSGDPTPSDRSVVASKRPPRRLRALRSTTDTSPSRPEQTEGSISSCSDSRSPRCSSSSGPSTGPSSFSVSLQEAAYRKTQL